VNAQSKAPKARPLHIDLSGAFIRHTDLSGVDLTDARNLTREQLATAIIDETTILPSYLCPLAGRIVQ
jgi:uncharacterized protein YjbI with pentapeptide repeats